MIVGVTGAAGKTGKAVIAALLDRGVSVRALVRTESHRRGLSTLSGVETAAGDMRQPAEMAAGLEGARSLYHIPPNMDPEEGEMINAALEAAVEIGVEHFVYHSVLHPQIRAMPHHWRKLGAEEVLLESGLPFTILQPAAYMQNLRDAFEAAAASGVFRVPYGPSVRLSVVDLADVAEVAAEVITADGHRGAIYELAGPDSPSQWEVGERMAEVLERAIRVERQSLDDWASEARDRGLAAGRVDDFLAMFRHYDRHDFIGNPRTLAGLLGREPTSLINVLRRWRSPSTTVG